MSREEQITRVLNGLQKGTAAERLTYQVLIIDGVFDAMDALVNCFQRISFEPNGELSAPQSIPKEHMVQEAKAALKRAEEVALHLLKIVDVTGGSIPPAAIGDKL